MPNRSILPALPNPSADVRAEALARARRIADGLFPHQVDGVAFLLGRRAAILADDMGLGKTRQAIMALPEAAPEGPWLVIAPASVKRNWGREIAAVRRADAVSLVEGSDTVIGQRGWTIINYDLLSRHADALAGVRWGGIVFDEAHYLKNHDSQRSKVARRIVERAPDAMIYCLTGTPLTNRPRDLFPLLQVVRHPMARSFLSFAKRYCAATHNGFGWVTDGASNLDELRVQLHGVMLRRTKDEVLDLPPKIRRWLPVSVPEGTARREMRKVVETLMTATGEKGDRTNLLAALSKARHRLAAAKVPTTIEFVEGAVAQGEKVIVFTGFEEPAQKIAEHFGEAAVLLTGKTPAPRRQALVDRFQSDASVRVFVANIVAGGVGITLTAARQVVFNDLDWVPANHWQAEDRAYRIGQTETVQVSYLVASGTIDEFVWSALQTKAALIEAVVEGRGEAPLDGDLISELARLVGQLSPQLATLGDDESGEDPVDRLLRDVVQASRAAETRDTIERTVLHGTLPAEAVEALARVLVGPTVHRYRAESRSKPGAYYDLDVDGADVTCTCRGFEYRGACEHSRSLKTALTRGDALPEGYSIANS